jgi:hypothetical protein
MVGGYMSQPLAFCRLSDHYPIHNPDETGDIMRLIIEIRAAEGGDDAKHLVNIQAGVYEQFIKRSGGAISATQAGLG